MIIYLSYSMRDYGSDYISNVKHDLIDMYGDDTTIIDPSEYTSSCIAEKTRADFMHNMINVFYPLIDSCNILVAVPQSSVDPATHVGPIYSSGVNNEIKYAVRNGTRVHKITDDINIPIDEDIEYTI